jgi:hypothetical protein
MIFESCLNLDSKMAAELANYISVCKNKYCNYDFEDAAITRENSNNIFMFAPLDLHEFGPKTYLFILANWFFLHDIPRAGW